MSAASVRVYDGALSIDDIGIALDLPAIPELVRRMQAHGLAEVTVARGAPPADLLVLLRTLAGEPERMFDASTIKRRLGKAAAASIVVLPAKGLESVSGRRAASITQAFELVSFDDDPPAAPAGGAPAGPAASAVPPQRLSRAVGSAEVDWLAGVPADTPLGTALQAVTLDPYGEKILDRVAELGRAIDRAFRNNQIEVAARALTAVVGLEPGAPDGTPRSSYVITIRRALTREVLAQLAQRVTDQQLAPLVTPLLERGGADAVEILLGHLSKAEVGVK